MERRPVSEQLEKLERLQNDTRQRIEEERKVIARRRNLETTAVLRERRLRYFRQWRSQWPRS
jgi:hypothetical protein